MNKTHEAEKARLAREKALFQYTNALERGDFVTVELILAQAAVDPVLEQLIVDMHGSDEEQQLLSPDHAVAVVRQLIRQCLPSALNSAPEILDQPLTVSDVCARLQETAAIKGTDEPEVGKLTQHLRDSTVPLPDKLTTRSLRHFFERLGVTLSARARELFRDAALNLTQSRDVNIAHYAAARRQRRRSRSSTTTGPRGEG